MSATTASTRRRIAALRAPKRCNCLFWAWARLRRRGRQPAHPPGYLSWRTSFYSRVCPHVAFSPDQKTCWAYSPIDPPPKQWWEYLLPWRVILFRGQIVLGDAAAVREHARVVLVARNAKILLAVVREGLMTTRSIRFATATATATATAIALLAIAAVVPLASWGPASKVAALVSDPAVGDLAAKVKTLVDGLKLLPSTVTGAVSSDKLTTIKGWIGDLVKLATDVSTTTSLATATPLVTQIGKVVDDVRSEEHT